APATLSDRSPPIVRARKRTAAWLTLLFLALGMLVSVGLGSEAAVIYVLSLPVPLFLLWMATDVLRSDELRGVEESSEGEVKPEHVVPVAVARS
ncbi:MAG: hypothetical protein K0S65_5295, partial [Labilithrix sp.]|nr:hypothetical protein [Labilithrix sp.]